MRWRERGRGNASGSFEITLLIFANIGSRVAIVSVTSTQLVVLARRCCAISAVLHLGLRLDQQDGAALGMWVRTDGDGRAVDSQGSGCEDEG